MMKLQRLKKCLFSIGLLALMTLISPVYATSAIKSQGAHPEIAQQNIPYGKRGMACPCMNGGQGMMGSGMGMYGGQGMMMQGMLDPASFDQRFTETMIMHKQRSIMMAQQAVKYAQNSSVRKIAQDIIIQDQQMLDRLKALQVK